MQFEMILKENSPYTHYCPRPLITGDVRAYRVVIKTEQILEGATLMATAIRSDGQAVTDIGEMHGGYGEYILANNMYSVEGDMRLMLTIVDYDGAALTAKEILFTVAAGGNEEAIDGDDRVPALNNLIAKSNQLLGECERLTEDYGEIIQLYTNLLNPERISGGSVYIDGLEKGRAYSFNFPYEVVMGMTDEGTAETVECSATGGGTCIAAEDMNYTALSIVFDSTLDTTQFMFVEGETLPPYFKSYGTNGYINDGLLKSVYAEIDEIKQSVIVSTPSEYGAVQLSPGKVHKLTVDKSISFILPYAEAYSTITVQANITAEAAIDWGTTYFFRNEIPYIEEGKYDFFFEYDSGAWYAGAVPKGQVIV